MWPIATSAASPPCRWLSSSSRSTVPSGVVPTISMTIPTSRSSMSSMSALLTYSERVTITRSPAFSRSEAIAVCQARVALSVSATSSGAQPASVAIDSYVRSILSSDPRAVS